ncbi:type II secretion system F family protein [Rhizobium sp. TRM95796]|uniref:type II secretion system F family protein n=1 Tax=Rhizobium sp. TRM95796 TaxID=2979862 RepID=UPI0021E7A33B|nr:type II secretion system F family protein [Rhizobium sp. TRM95796]MCV3768453.1 type II secretion system F family protein [Rhizobium sp. TRM95796]
MFGFDLTTIAIIALAAISAAAVAYGVLFSQIESDKKAKSRFEKMGMSDVDKTKVKASRDRLAELSKRRKSVQDSLKELEKKQQEANKKKAATLKSRIVQAGLSFSETQFYLGSAVLGAAVAVLLLFSGASILIIAGVSFVAAVGLPRLYVTFMFKRRMKRFIEELPNALDVMVRSIKSGLPLNDAIRLIASEAKEPVKTEFRRVIEAQQMGLSVPEAVGRMSQTVPLQEVNFFGVVIAIQAQAGGNLSEALGNLSRVLRDRKKMKAKVSALSMEAKASAVIIGALPFIVALLVYLTSPDYMLILFTDPRGHLIMGVSAVWMAIGIFVMRNMTNFEI